RRSDIGMPMNRTRRRQLLFAAAALLTAPLVCVAQQQRRVWRIGFLAADSRQSFVESGRYAAFLEGMRELGYVEGKNFVVDERFTEGKPERLSNLAEELVRRNVDVILIAVSDAGRAAQRATTTIPIVLATAADPVRAGLVASL